MYVLGAHRAQIGHLPDRVGPGRSEGRGGQPRRPLPRRAAEHAGFTVTGQLENEAGAWMLLTRPARR
jgi:hypothetical protein